MKYVGRMLAGFYILISVFTILSLGGCVRGDYRGDRHYYRDGSWYRHDSLGASIVVSALAIGALIDSLPPIHTTVVVEGNPYYHDDRYYYRRSSQGGYVVVPTPVMVKPQSQSNHGERGERGGKRNEGNRGQNH